MHSNLYTTAYTSTRGDHAAAFKRKRARRRDHCGHHARSGLRRRLSTRSVAHPAYARARDARSGRDLRAPASAVDGVSKSPGTRQLAQTPRPGPTGVGCRRGQQRTRRTRKLERTVRTKVPGPTGVGCHGVSSAHGARVSSLVQSRRGPSGPRAPRSSRRGRRRRKWR
jgi:hypothetical protein